MVTGSAVQYGGFQVSQTLMNSILSLFLVIVVGLAWEGRLLGQTIAVVFFGLIALFLTYRSGYLKYPENAGFYIKDAMRFGFPLIPHTIGAFVIYSTDRVIISNLKSLNNIIDYKRKEREAKEKEKEKRELEEKMEILEKQNKE